MIKQEMRFLAVLENADSQEVGFERFGCKKPETVRKNMEWLLDQPLYRACVRMDGAVRVAIYATPDGYGREPSPCLCFDIRRAE